MLILLDVHSGVPAYRQIVEQVRLLIAGGKLGAGDELPSTRLLAAQLGINPMTVSKAYGLLEDEGLVTHRPGLPLTVKPPTRAAKPQGDAARLEALEQALDPVARTAVQLGVDADTAARMLRTLMHAHLSHSSE